MNKPDNVQVLHDRLIDAVSRCRRGETEPSELRRELRNVYADALAAGPEVETALTALLDDDPYDPRLLIG